MILTKVLATSGFEVLQAGNGKQALEILKHESATIKLVLVDWNMPELNGLEFIKIVRATPDLRDIRVMMVTTESEMAQVVQAASAGVDDYLLKPFDRETLEEKLRLLGALPDPSADSFR